MPAPSVTYTFSNSTTADATQVNQNFTDLINGLSDGTKDLSVSAITAAGNVSLQGNVTLGNSSSDDLTITGSLASSVPIKTTFSYDIGSATIGLKSLYLGSNDSAARSVRLIAPAVASSYTYTLPTSGGTSGFVLKTDGSGTTSWESRLTYLRAAKTSNYTATTSDEVLTCDASGGSFTITLPAAASSTNKVLKIIRTDQTLANSVTIDGNSSETINGNTTFKLMTQYESVAIICDGSNWFVLDHNIPSFSTTVSTPSITGSTSNPTKGTATVDQYVWRRVGNRIHVIYQYLQPSVGGANGSGTYYFALIPTGLSIKTSETGDVDSDGFENGHGGGYAQGAAGSGAAFVSVKDSTLVRIVWTSASAATSAIGSSSLQLSGTNLTYMVDFTLPITDWEG